MAAGLTTQKMAKKEFDYHHCSENCLLSAFDMLRQNCKRPENSVLIRVNPCFFNGGGNMANIVFSILLRFNGNQKKIILSF